METVKKQYRLFPNFGDSFGTGWDVMMDNFLRLFLLVIILGIIAAPMHSSNIHFNLDNLDFRHFEPEDFFRFGTFGILAAFFGMLWLLYGFLVAPVFRYGGKLMFLQGVRQEKPDFEYLIKGFSENYLTIILANLLVTALIALGVIMIIVPGIIIACRLAFVPYIVMDKKLDPIEAVEESWRMTRGYGWTIFFMGFVSIFIYIAGFILLFVGLIPASIWVGSSFASIYQAVLLEREKPAEQAPVQI